MTWAEEHHEELLTSLVEILQEEAFHDLKLHLGDGDVDASRPLMAAMSPVFRRMLTVPMQERIKGKVRLELVSKQAWGVLVSFYYSREKRVTVENVEEILAIADLYQMKALKTFCSTVLSDGVTVENWFGMLKLGKRYEFTDSVTDVFRFMGRHFDFARLSEEFWKLTREDVLRLLNDTYLICTEDGIYSAILTWLENNETDKDSALELFNQIKLEDVSNDCISNEVMYHQQVISNESIRNAVAEEMKKRRLAVPEFKNPSNRPPKHADDILVLGYDGSGMKVYGARAPVKKWCPLPSTNAGEHFAACMLQGTIYVTGGRGFETSTRIFDVETTTWSNGPNLVQGRSAHGMTSIADSLFAVAGRDERSRPRSSIEEYDPEKKVWTQIGDLQHPTELCGVAVAENVIIVVGGQSAGRIIQAFHLTTKTAAVVENHLPRTVYFARGAKLLNRAVFLSGNGDLLLVSISDHNRLVVEHRRCPGFDNRRDFGLLVGNQVEVFGGDNGAGPGSTVSCYSLEGGTQDRNVSPLPVPLFVYGAFKTKLLTL